VKTRKVAATQRLFDWPWRVHRTPRSRGTADLGNIRRSV